MTFTFMSDVKKEDKILKPRWQRKCAPRRVKITVAYSNAANHII